MFFYFHGRLVHSPFTFICGFLLSLFEVTLKEFQECIKVRHAMGSRGGETTADGIGAVDSLAPP